MSKTSHFYFFFGNRVDDFKNDNWGGISIQTTKRKLLEIYESSKWFQLLKFVWKNLNSARLYAPSISINALRARGAGFLFLHLERCNIQAGSLASLSYPLYLSLTFSFSTAFVCKAWWCAILVSLYLELVSEEEDFGFRGRATIVHGGHWRIAKGRLRPLGLYKPLHDGLQAFLEGVDFRQNLVQERLPSLGWGN